MKVDDYVSKVTKFMKNRKFIFAIGFILGGLILGGTTYVIATSIASSNITYTSNGQSTVQGALNDLYTKSNTWIDPSYIDFTTLATNTKKTILASSAGICIKRNGKVSCMKKNNWSVEKNHIKQIFSDISCNEYSDNVDCDASDFYCDVADLGDVYCHDNSDYSYCCVYSDGSVNCND